MNGISRRGLLKSGAAAGGLGLSGMPLRAQTRGGKLTAGLSGANTCLLYTSPSPRDATLSRMPSSA